MIKLALRNTVRQKARTAMTLAAVVIGVAGLILSGGFVADVFAQLAEAVIRSQSGHLQIASKGFFTRGSRAPEKYLIKDTEAIVRLAQSLPDVDDVMARMHFAGLINNGRTDLAIFGEGVQPDKEARLGTYIRILAGRQLTANDEFGILVGEGVAKSLGLSPGDAVTLLLNTAEGALNTIDFQVVGVFQTFSKDFDARAVRITLPAARELLGTGGANALVLALKSTSKTDLVAATLTARLGAQTEVKTWYELNDFYGKTVELYEKQFGVLRLIILVMVLLSVVNTLNMTLFERVGEFGTMRALGNRGRDIFLLVLTEGAIFGFFGALLGIIVGVAAAMSISEIGIPMPPPPNANIGYTAHILIVPSVVAGAFLVGFFATILGAIVPALRVSRMAVVDALRQNA
jgi:putative ABC transport system permease protein